MATETLLEGAVTFAPAGWSGSGIADSNDYVVNKPFGPVAAGLDQSSLTIGIESMEFYPGSVGVVGGGAAGPLILDADASADAFVNNYGNVTLYLKAGGGSGVISNFACGSGSINYLQGGSFPTIVLDGGTLFLNASTDFDDMEQNGGALTVEYLSTNADSAELNAGTSIWKRMPTAMTVSGGRHVIDLDDAEDVAGKSLTVTGGSVQIVSGSIPTVSFNAGEVDLTKARKAITLGGTAGTFTKACRIMRNDARVDISALVNTGSSKSSAGGATPL